MIHITRRPYLQSLRDPFHGHHRLRPQSPRDLPLPPVPTIHHAINRSLIFSSPQPSKNGRARLCVNTQDLFTFRTNEGSTLSVRSISKNCCGRSGTRSNTKIDPPALSEPFMEFGRFGEE